MDNSFLENYFGDKAIQTDKQRQDENRRYFQIAGITICVESNLNFGEINFKDELMTFAVDGPGEDNVVLSHYFEIPNLTGKDLGREIFRSPPWAISHKDGTWFYKGIFPEEDDSELHRLAIFNADHTQATIFSPPHDRELVLNKGWHSLSLFPTDQIWLGPLLADRNAVLLHSAAAIVNGLGLAFIGHSDAGKSTTMEILKTASKEKSIDAEILCDDRNVIRKWDDCWRVHGTWSHGTTADVSPSNAPLKAILFLEQSEQNEIIPITDHKYVWRVLLATLIRAMVTADWWHKELDILEKLVDETTCYVMRFNKSGTIVKELERLTR